MDMNQAVWDNLRFFLSRLRALRCCRGGDIPGGFCLSTRSESASDNWVYAPDAKGGEDAARQALDFFQGEPFVWPLLPDADAAPLRRCGLREAGRLLGMALDPSKGPEGKPQGDKSRGDDSPPALGFTVSAPRRWAEAAWMGFGGERGTTPPAFRELAEAAQSDPLFRLVTAQIGESDGRMEDVGTLLLACSPRTVGLYYFAVLPAYRRRGIASALLKEARRLATREKSLVLQATPAGVPFYRSVGFQPLSEIPLFSGSDDVF